MSVPRGRACLDGESPQKSPQTNCVACSQPDGQVENPRSDKFRRCSKGWGASIEGVRDSCSILRAPPKLLNPSTGAVTSEPFIGTDARSVHRRNKMECLWVVRWVSRAKPSETPTNSPRLGPINIGVCGFCFGFDLGLFRWRTGTKPAHSNDGNRSRIGSIYDDALYGQLRRVMPEMKW